jgi:hypothetical protein
MVDQQLKAVWYIFQLFYCLINLHLHIQRLAENNALQIAFFGSFLQQSMSSLALLCNRVVRKKTSLQIISTIFYVLQMSIKEREVNGNLVKNLVVLPKQEKFTKNELHSGKGSPVLLTVDSTDPSR